MKIEPFVPFNHLLKAVKVSPTYVEQGEVCVTMESLAESVGIIKISGIISADQVNALGTTPYVFSTPEMFVPLAFSITVDSGTVPPAFSDNLVVNTVSLSRTVFHGQAPGSIGFYNLYGYNVEVGLPSFTQALNIEISANNFQLTPMDSADPVAGDMSFKYNLIGYIFK